MAQITDRYDTFDPYAPPPDDESGHHLHDGRRGTDGSVGAQLATSVVFPGVAALRRSPFLAVALVLFGIVLPIVLVSLVYVNRAELVGFALDPTFLLGATVIGLGAVVARLVAVAEVASVFRHVPGVGPRAAVAVLAVCALGAPVLFGAYQSNAARSIVADVFANDSDEPLFSPADSTIIASDGTVVDRSEVRNILVLGGDAGPGRWGMRTDTMIVVSVNERSGRTALVSIPRNLTNLQFPPGTALANIFPNGFGDLANAVFTQVNNDPGLVAAYSRDGLQPEAVALSEAVGHSLNIRIDDFALVNMQGFADVIDAVGGVTLDVGGNIPLPPSLPGERPLPPSIGPGLVDMDGALAIAYVRSREADSDYQRMGRQRQLLAAVGSQVSPADALGAFTTVSGVLDDSMRTSLSSGEFNTLLSRLGDNSAIRESVGLTPPLISPGAPDYGQIRQIVADVQVALVADRPSGYAG